MNIRNRIEQDLLLQWFLQQMTVLALVTKVRQMKTMIFS